MSTYDAIIVGGGPAGLVVALGLAEAGARIAIIEPNPPRPRVEASGFDLRVSTFSPASIAILDGVGAWEHVPADRAFVFDAMAVWETHPDRALRFHADDGGLASLGAVIENETVRRALWRVAEERCEVIESRVEKLDLDGEPRMLVGDRKLRGRVLVGADGGRSMVRTASGISTRRHDFFQSGLVGVIRTGRPHGGVARQRFLPGGPLALLPLDEKHVSIVWSLPTAKAQRMAELGDQAFAEHLSDAAQGVLGSLAPAGARTTFPLISQLARRYVAGQAVLVGDAAHQIHPLAGQGANLGLLDAAALVECLTSDASTALSLRRYERWRRSEATLMALGIHGIGACYRWGGIAGDLRRLGTRIVDRLPLVSGAFVQQASGYGGKVPALARRRVAGIS